MILNWTPSNNASSTGQLAKRIARINGNTPTLTTGFLPTNPLSATASTTTFGVPLDNIVYKFNVSTTCNIGQPTSNIFEMIKFGCVPISFEVRKNNQLYCQVNHTQYTSIDGVTYSEAVGDIENVEFSLYDSTGNNLVQGPIIGNVASMGFSQFFSSVVFNNLTPSTTYVIKYTLLSTVNGSQIRSDIGTQLGQKCTDSIVLPATNNTGFFSIRNTAPTNLTSSSIDVINTSPIPFFTLNTGSNIVYNGQSSLGNHSAFSGSISAIVNTSTYPVNALLRVNSNIIQTILVNNNLNTTISFNNQNFLATDSIEIILNPLVINLSFNWTCSANQNINLNNSVSGYGINGTIASIDWGDGTVNNSLTHIYTNAGNYTVNIIGSNTTILNLPNKGINSITTIPSTLEKLYLSGNNITTYPILTSNNLMEVDFNNNSISNVPVFTNTPNLSFISLINNSIIGGINVSNLPLLKTLGISNNIGINSLSDLNANPALEILAITNTSINAMPNLTDCPNLLVLEMNNIPATGILDVTNNINLSQLSLDNVALTSNLNISNNNNLTYYSAQNTNLIGTISFANNPNLQNINISNNSINNIISFTTTNITSGTFNNNNLPVSIVNTILNHANSKNLSGTYTINTKFQNPVAIPTGTGLTAKAALIARGYVVNTD